jgi:hypothetical protein
MKHFLISYLLGWLMMFGIFGTIALVAYINMHYWPGPPSTEFVCGTFSAFASMILLALMAIVIFSGRAP